MGTNGSQYCPKIYSLKVTTDKDPKVTTGVINMSTAARKLQVEIDKTCKKIIEGIEEFHELLQKYNDSVNPSHKEKLEGELKKEIKKLQRLRDQVKSWQASSEVKEKSQLYEVRKAIEAEMEKFKILEKEMKIKAYSKEGLTLSTRLDPKDHEKQAISIWINNCVSRLSSEVDQFEAEMETFSSTKKIKKTENLGALEHRLKRHKYHILKLEAILRSFENNVLQVEDINEIKNDVDYYVDFHNDASFEENLELYEDLDLIESRNKIYMQSEQASQKKEPLSAHTESSIIEHMTLLEGRPGEDEMATDVDSSSFNTTPIFTPKIQGPSFASAALMGGKAKPSSQKNIVEHEDSTTLAHHKNFENLRAKARSLTADFESGFKHLDRLETDIQSAQFSKTSTTASSFYPQVPPTIFCNPTLFEKFDLDTLFFIFYFQQKTVSQYLASQELKRRSWRFHKKYHTWFQRHEEPKAITADYEHGTYIYFDFESAWCQRKKAEFTFEYQYLEDNDIVS